LTCGAGADNFGIRAHCLKVVRMLILFLLLFYLFFAPQKAEPNDFNDFLQDFKDTLIAKARQDFWQKVVTGNLFLFIYLSTYIAFILALCVSSKRFYTLTLLAMLPG
jgi:hypothetical protein